MSLLTSAATNPFYAREVAGGDELRAELVGAINQPSKLQILIAQHTRVRRPAGLVFVGKVTDDVLLKLGGFVNQVIRDAELVADRAGVGDGLGAAAFILGAVHAILRPELERDADDLITLLQQQRRSGGGVHSTAHADDNALTLLRIHSRTLYNARAACKLRLRRKMNFTTSLIPAFSPRRRRMFRRVFEKSATVFAGQTANKTETCKSRSFSPGEKVRMRASVPANLPNS